MKWVSYWMMGIAVVHCVLAVVLYGQAYEQFAVNGVFASASTDYDRLAIWFCVAGVLMFLIGYLFLSMPYIPRLVGLTLAIVGVVGGLLIPASGFWLLLPPAIGIVLTQRKSTVS